MDVHQFFLIIWFRKWVIVGTALAVALLAALLSLVILPKTYSATSSIMLGFKSVDPITGAVLPMPFFSGYVATQADVIKSHRVALRVVDSLKLADNPEAQTRFKEETGGLGSVRDWLAESLARNLEVLPSKESSVVDIIYDGSDPQFVATMANAFAQAYLQTNLEVAVEPARQSTVWLDSKLQGLRANLEKAQARLSEYQQQKGIVAVDERIDVENARLAELSAQLTLAQSQLFDSTARHAQAVAGRGSAPEVVANPLVQGLKGELGRAEARLNEISSRLGRNHPKYEGVVAERDSIRRRLDIETGVIGGSLGSSERSAKQREAELQRVTSDQKKRVLELKKLRDQMAVLSHEVENAQRVYDNAILRVDQTRLESQSNATNVAMLRAAVAPIKPSKPNALRNVMLGSFLGTLMGAGLGFLVEILDRRVRTIGDVREGVGMAVLGNLRRAPIRSNRWLPGLPKLLRRSSEAAA
jgi:polysaccharide biosynthesis transport protein